jgi:hypothetical protein
LGEHHIRNGFALGEPCCWPHGLRVERMLGRVRGVIVMDRGYRYANLDALDFDMAEIDKEQK